MKHTLLKRALCGLGLGLLVGTASLPAAYAQSNMVTYLGNQGREQLYGMLRLSDGTVLVAGRATNLNWLPATTPRSVIAIPQRPSAENPAIMGINSFDTSAVGFIAHMTANMDSIMAVAQFPAGTVGDVTRIRTNTGVGETTGDIYVSGRRNRTVSPSATDASRGDGYYIAKLNANFMTGLPTAALWTRDVRAQQRRSNQPGGTPWGPGGVPGTGGTEGDFKRYQPWDVQRDGKVLYVGGRELSDDWASVTRLTADGLNSDTVGGWFHQNVRLRAINDVFSDGTIYRNDAFYGLTISQLKGVDTIRNYIYNIPNTNPTQRDTIAKVVIDSLRYSDLILKTNRGGSNFRSHNDVDFNMVMVDENGNGGRKGKYPDDLFYDSPCIKGYFGAPAACTQNGPGYTGISLDVNGNNTATQRAVSLTVDRRNNDLYYGYATWTQHPLSQGDDFEPAVVATRENGTMKWWARLYKEDTALLATAKQFVDGVDIDYANNQLVVLGWTQGDSPANFWRGDSLTSKPGGQGFQNDFTGSNRDGINVRWLGKFNLNTGAILHSTYVGERAATESNGTASTMANMDGWSSPNSKDFNLANTEVTAWNIGPDGSVYIAGRSEGRTLTTRNAFMKMPQMDGNATPDSMVGPHTFVRVYNPTLDTVTYSSLLTGVWDVTDGTGGDEAKLNAILPTADGMLVTGFHQLNALGTAVRGSSMPLVNVPKYGRDTLESEAGLVARLTFNCTNTLAQPGPISGPTSACQNAEMRFKATPVAGATRYFWALPGGGNFTGFSRTDSITIMGANGPGGGLRVVAVNSCGVSPIAALRLDPPTVTARPTAITPNVAHCQGAVVTYRAIGGPAGVTYRWSLPAGWVPASGNLADTMGLADSIQVRVPLGVTTGGQLRVITIGQCGPSTPTILNRGVPGAPPAQPAAITFAGGNAQQCVGTAKTFSITAVTGAQGYTWTVPAGWTGTSTNTSISITAQPGATGGTLTVQARNACGLSTPQTISLPDPATPLAAPAISIDPVTGRLYLSTPQVPGLNYQWKRGGTVNVGAPGDTSLHPGNTAGTYTLTISNVCGTVSSNGIAITSVNDVINRTAVRVYPNPSNGVFNIENAGGANTTVRVINVLGKEMGRFSLTNGQVDLSNQPDGIYFFEITNGSSRVVQRVEKQ